MIFAAHQPHYLPWLRYLHKVAAADVFVILDDAQYTKNGWQNRTYIKGADGPVLLSVPVHARLGATFREVRPTRSRWVQKHIAALESCYGGALSAWRPALTGILEERAEGDLAALDEGLLQVLVEGLAIDTPLVRSSDLGVEGTASRRLADIGRALGADVYLTGAYALGAYLDPEPFAAAGIAIAVQSWSCPRYRQRFPGTGFLEDLSALDLLVNEPDSCRSILLEAGEVVPLGAFEAAPVT